MTPEFFIDLGALKKEVILDLAMNQNHIYSVKTFCVYCVPKTPYAGQHVV